MEIQYYKNVCNNSDYDSKKLWNIIKYVTSESKSNIQILMVNNK